VALLTFTAINDAMMLNYLSLYFSHLKRYPSLARERETSPMCIQEENGLTLIVLSGWFGLCGESIYDVTSINDL